MEKDNEKLIQALNEINSTLKWIKGYMGISFLGLVTILIWIMLAIVSNS